MNEISYYQTVTANMRIMELMDGDRDGYIDEEEIRPFHAEAPSNIPDWSSLLAMMDVTADGKISHSEQRFYFEQANRNFMRMVADDSAPWGMRIPREWFRQYIAEGAFLERFAKFCSKVNIVHGEVDMQTPFEDVLELKALCASRNTPLKSFASFRDLGHGFSPRVGLKSWKDTIGPIDTNVLAYIARVVYENLDSKKLADGQ
jgi:hypothetical protein